MNKPEFRRTDAPIEELKLAASADDWVHELIAMTRPGVEIEFPSRTLRDRVIPFEYDDFS